MAPSSQEQNSSNADNLVEADVELRPTMRYTDKRWTLGNSAELVEGQPKESPLVTAAWLVVPTVLALLLLSLMVH